MIGGWMSKKNLNEEETIEGEVTKSEEVEIEAIIFFRPVCQPFSDDLRQRKQKGQRQTPELSPLPAKAPIRNG
jgi:hypothetical protein